MPIAGLTALAASAHADPASHANPASHASRAARASQAAVDGGPVVFVGIPGLRWAGVSAKATPNLWRIAGQGSPGTLVVRTVLPRTCPVDGWLTLNAGARAMAQHKEKGQCPPIPAPSALPSIARYNQRFHYNPHWGLLASAAGPGGCATAAGPGAALALASRSGLAARSVSVTSGVSRSALARCPLTVVDLGAAGAGGGGVAAVQAADAALGRIAADMPPGGLLIVAAPADAASPHLRVLVVSGPGYRAGVLATASTRQPGMVQITDLTAAILAWRHQPIPSDLVGSPVSRAARGASLAATVRALAGEDTAAQVYRSTAAWFFAAYAVGDCVVFGAIMLFFWGASRRRRRHACARIAGAFTGAVVPGSFLASVVSWWLLPHPAIMLYAMTAGWAAVAGAAALAGPWRRDPFGPAGFVGLVTVGVIGLDVMTGSRLQMGTPFGLSALLAGRFYGVGNNALGPYAAAGMLAAGWLAGVAARRSFAVTGGSIDGAGPRHRARGDAALAVTAVAVFAVIASGWPGFGSKFGGTVAMVPGFILLGLCAAGVRVTGRRAVAIAVSGVAAVTLFALVNYFVPITGHSHIGEFVGQVLHGGAGGVLQRKISSNIGSLTITPYSPLVPLVVIALGVLLARPRWLRASWLPAIWEKVPLLRPTLAAMWVVAVLGWLADDSGVTVAAAALPFALPLAIAIHAGVRGPEPDAAGPDAPPPPDSARAVEHAENAAGGQVGRG
ncbi:MAG: hypothetical protein ACM3ML_29725 [Micromonosporaceae bacterium]